MSSKTETIQKYLENCSIGRKRKQTPKLPKSTLQTSVKTSDNVEIFWKLKLYSTESFIKMSGYVCLLDRLQTKCNRKTTQSFSFLGREKPSSSPLCVSSLCVSFTTHAKHFISDTSGLRACGGFSPQQTTL